eukprot:CAMPEP_0119119980 /NCGR_PEP_ID=MMETSP1310-20130426/1231_1 /TAXON_ID=464262 /ORGANISM="Genus nov. species nov., Strain RCC2339" /LENGTH=340 /DNA_ID=CAMNT_0007109441 /DNA_START=140 /DNA_END=1162 /DNA_ORIENTATION=+
MKLVEEALSIVKVEALGTETHHLNGENRVVTCVVKNNAILFWLKLGTPGISFDRVGLRMTLHYDSLKREEVSFIKAPPLNTKVRVMGDKSEAEVQGLIHVLSSQHEGLFFLVHFQCLDAATGAPIDGHGAWSPPIKVISKPQQFNQTKFRQKRKRPLHQEVVEQLATIEARQEAQADVLDKILAQLAANMAALSPAMRADVPPPPPSLRGGSPDVVDSCSFDTYSSDGTQALTSPLLMDDDVPSFALGEESFGDARPSLRRFLDACKAVPVEERPRKIRRLASSLDAQDLAIVRELAATGDHHAGPCDIGQLRSPDPFSPFGMVRDSGFHALPPQPDYCE